MVICGIKLTHDSAIALIDNNRLICCHELEKVNNRQRHALLDNFTLVADVIGEYGYKISDIDSFAIDGWDDLGEKEKDGTSLFRLPVKNGDIQDMFTLARYGHFIRPEDDVLEHHVLNTPSTGIGYTSYMHVSGHIFSAYCTSPFAADNEDTFILVWDGGMCPQLFYLHAGSLQTENLGCITPLNGNIYALFAQYFSPFREIAKDRYDLSIAGKVMAYTGLGTPDMALVGIFNNVLQNLPPTVADSQELVTQFISAIPADHTLSNADIIASFDKFLEQQLLNGLQQRIAALPGYNRLLCYAGGCALNIKWNSAVRSSGLFRSMWIPPFPNDAGSAIGAACCEMVRVNRKAYLHWNVYSGPAVREKEISWEQIPCNNKQLAAVLYHSHEPVVMLNGRAELGPRSLGNRSILANPVTSAMKDKLNDIKDREDYRPIAPVCMEAYAPAIFTPGTPDRLMLYDHDIKQEWLDRIPAVCHVDGSARLQTINQEENTVLHDLLKEFHALSGIPLLCNTSANYKGRGFFPDVQSVIKWGKVNFVWSNGLLYFSPEGKTVLGTLPALSRETIL
jgi:carbamoyltransferase